MKPKRSRRTGRYLRVKRRKGRNVRRRKGKGHVMTVARVLKRLVPTL